MSGTEISPWKPAATVQLSIRFFLTMEPQQRYVASKKLLARRRNGYRPGAVLSSPLAKVFSGPRAVAPPNRRDDCAALRVQFPGLGIAAHPRTCEPNWL